MHRIFFAFDRKMLKCILWYMATDTHTILNVKTDKKLKARAKKVAGELGVPLSVVVNQYLKQFVAERSIAFEKPPMPNAKTRKELDEALKDVKHGRNLSGPFETAEEMIASLRS